MNVVINPESLVTFQEVRLAFLLMVGVDPSLVSEAWIANAYHMIILKLVHLENSFVAFEKFEILSPLNVIHQLKYRYDKEIDGAKRPILRKIVEMDDVACKRMVLKVIAIAKVRIKQIVFELFH